MWSELIIKVSPLSNNTGAQKKKCKSWRNWR